MIQNKDLPVEGHVDSCGIDLGSLLGTETGTTVRTTIPHGDSLPTMFEAVYRADAMNYGLV